jgi:hypothetical protein
VPYTVAKIRALAKFINASEKRWDQFRAFQLEIAIDAGDTKHRVLRCFQDVKTRWDSTNRMLMRARVLRVAIEKYCEAHCPHLMLNASEWQQVDYVVSVLRPFAVFTQLIGTTRDPTIHRVFGVYSLLLNHLDSCTKRLKRKRMQWKVLMLEGLEAARVKLFEYYEKTEVSDAGPLYGIAILLDPAAKEAFWQAGHWREDLGWQASYWVEFERLYQTTYGPRPLITKRLAAPKEMRQRREPNLDDIMHRIHTDQENDQQDVEATDADVELADYRQYSRFMVVFMVVVSC